jgi:hypothetical protein
VRTSEGIIYVSAAATARLLILISHDEGDKNSHCPSEHAHEDVGPGLGDESVIVEGEGSVDRDVVTKKKTRLGWAVEIWALLSRIDRLLGLHRLGAGYLGVGGC